MVKGLIKGRIRASRVIRPACVRQGPRVSVRNGYSCKQSVSRVRDVLPLSPAIVSASRTLYRRMRSARRWNGSFGIAKTLHGRAASGCAVCRARSPFSVREPFHGRQNRPGGPLTGAFPPPPERFPSVNRQYVSGFPGYPQRAWPCLRTWAACWLQPVPQWGSQEFHRAGGG